MDEGLCLTQIRMMSTLGHVIMGAGADPITRAQHVVGNAQRLTLFNATFDNVSTSKFARLSRERNHPRHSGHPLNIL